MTHSFGSLAVRVGKFNTVGLLGIAVQIAVLYVLKSVLGMHYLLATALAVEAAVLHNFFWHQAWTWSDRHGGSTLARLVRFNLSSGALSILSNVVLMRIFAGALHVPYIAANLCAIAITSIANYLVADLFVFRRLGQNDSRMLS